MAMGDYEEATDSFRPESERNDNDDDKIVPAEIFSHTGSRRNFLRNSVGLALSSAVLPSAAAIAFNEPTSLASSGEIMGTSNGTYEYFFDLSYHDLENSDYYLVSAGFTEKLGTFSANDLLAAKAQFPYLDTINADRITHSGSFSLPIANHALLIVKSVATGQPHSDADAIPRAIFLHFPDQHVERAHEVLTARGYGTELPADPIGAQRFVEPADTASALGGFHPGSISLDSQAAAIVQAHIGLQDGYAELVEHITKNPETYLGIEELSDDDGQPSMVDMGQGVMIRASMFTIPEETGSLLLPVVTGTLNAVLDDEQLGADISAIDPDAKEEKLTLTGALWVTRDGSPGVEDDGLTAVPVQTGRHFIATDLTAVYPGATVEIVSTTNRADHTVVSAKITNHYNRYLGVYARFYDDQNKLMDTAPVGYNADPIQKAMGYPNADNCFAQGLSSPTFMVFGIPTFPTNIVMDIAVPLTASRVEILAGGLGSGNPTDQNIPASVSQWGAGMTGFACLAAPPLFIAAQAAIDYVGWLEGLKPLLVPAGIAAVFGGAEFIWLSTGDVDQLYNFTLSCTKMLLTNKTLWAYTLAAIGLGEVVDLIPFCGLAMNEAAAINIIANTDGILSEIELSPSAYLTSVVLTHDVIVNWDNLITPGVGVFVITLTTSAGAILYRNLPAGTSTTTFTGIPRGGEVSITLAAYLGKSVTEALSQGDSELIGTAETSVSQKTSAQTIKLDVDPVVRKLTSSTTYPVAAVTIASSFQLPDGIQQLAWRPVTDTWVAKVDPAISELHGITINRSTYDIGRSWRASNRAVPECGVGILNESDLSLFGNSSTKWNSVRTQDDLTASVRYFRTGENGRVEDFVFNDDACGFKSTTQVAYDQFEGTVGRNYYIDPSASNAVRQIRITTGERPDFDRPGSDLAVGRFNFESDSLLLHPSGVLISVSKDQHRMEILTPLETPGPDSDAPVANVLSGLGMRRGRLNGPVRMAVTSAGVILVAEQHNARVSAFDLAGNPVRFFKSTGGKKSYDFKLGTSDVPFKGTTQILDLAVEHAGHIYVLLSDSSGSNPSQTTGRYINIYQPDGQFLLRVTDTYAKRIAVDHWRIMYGMDGTSVDRSGSIAWSGPATGGVTEPAITISIPDSSGDLEPPIVPDPDPAILPETI